MFSSKHLSSSRWAPSFFMNLPLFDCCLPCRGSRDHHRPVCVYSPHIVSRLPFVFGCALSILWFCCSLSSLPCKKVAEMAAIRIHVPSKLSFYLWLELCPSRESAVAPFPRLLCRKALATVVGTRCESAVPRKGWTVIFFSPEGFLLFWFVWSVLPF
jgi:hypothetical protein